MNNTPETAREQKILIQQYQHEAVENSNTALLNKQLVAGFLPTEKFPSVEAAALKLAEMKDGIVAADIAAWVVAQVAEAASLGQFEGLYQFEGMIASKFSWNAICARANLLPMEKSIIIPAEQHWNSKFTPYIPSTNVLVDLRAHRHVSASDYEAGFALNGFSKYWAEKFWQGHYAPPSFGDALTARRRGVIDEKQLDDFMDLVGFDPEYKDVFDTRKYSDPPVLMARRLFDAHVIDADGVKAIVKRNGYNDADATLIARMTTTWTERTWRNRVLMLKVRQLAYGLIEPQELSDYVISQGYSMLFAAVTLQYAREMQKLLSRPSMAKEKEKLLSLGDLKAAFIRGLVTEDVFRTELLSRGYNLDDIQILLTLMSDRRTVEQAGGKMFALSVVELLNAWRYEVITEDDLRNKLLARGLPLDELETLIKTKTIQWQITPKTAG